MSRKQVGLRISEEAYDRFDRLADQIAEKLGGEELSRSVVVRMAVMRGLKILEKEFGPDETSAKQAAA